MNRAPAFVRLGVASGRWLFPWLSVLLISATLVYAISAGRAGGSPVGATMAVAGPRAEAFPGPCTDNSQPSPWPACSATREAEASTITR